MKNWKQLLALFLTAVMALSLVACKPDGGTDDPEDPSGQVSDGPDASASPAIVADLSKGPLEFAAGVSADDVLLTINGEDIPADMMLYYLNYVCFAYMNQYSMYGLGIDSFGDVLMPEAVSFCANNVILRQKAAQLGCLPTDAQTKEARERMAEDSDTVSFFKTNYGLTDRSVEYLFLAEAYYENMMAAATQEPETIYRVKHILFKTVDDNRQPLADDVVAEKRAQAEDVLAQLQAVSPDELEAKFDELMMAHSEDNPQNNPDGYTTTPGKMVAPFEEASLALEEGGMSGIVETAFGYHIILRLPLTDEGRAQCVQTYRAESLQQQVDQWTDEAEITKSDTLTNLNVSDFYSRMNAYLQALAERDAAESAPVESGGVG